MESRFYKGLCTNAHTYVWMYIYFLILCHVLGEKVWWFIIHIYYILLHSLWCYLWKLLRFGYKIELKLQSSKTASFHLYPDPQRQKTHPGVRYGVWIAGFRCFIKCNEIYRRFSLKHRLLWSADEAPSKGMRFEGTNGLSTRFISQYPVRVWRPHQEFQTDGI